MCVGGGGGRGLQATLVQCELHCSLGGGGAPETDITKLQFIYNQLIEK